MPFILDDETRLAPISKSKFNPATAQAVAPALQCWLKNADGAYLHFSGDACALEKAYRWHGTAAQAKKLREAHPFARTFRTLIAIA